MITIFHRDYTKKMKFYLFFGSEFAFVFLIIFLIVFLVCSPSEFNFHLRFYDFFITNFNVTFNRMHFLFVIYTLDGKKGSFHCSKKFFPLSLRSKDFKVKKTEERKH